MGEGGEGGGLGLRGAQRDGAASGGGGEGGDLLGDRARNLYPLLLGYLREVQCDLQQVQPRLLLQRLHRQGAAREVAGREHWTGDVLGQLAGGLTTPPPTPVTTAPMAT